MGPGLGQETGTVELGACPQDQQAMRQLTCPRESHLELCVDDEGVTGPSCRLLKPFSKTATLRDSILSSRRFMARLFLSSSSNFSEGLKEGGSSWSTKFSQQSVNSEIGEGNQTGPRGNSCSARSSCFLSPLFPSSSWILLCPGNSPSWVVSDLGPRRSHNPSFLASHRSRPPPHPTPAKPAPPGVCPLGAAKPLSYLGGP